MSETKMISIPGLPVEYQGATVRITPNEDAKSRWGEGFSGCVSSFSIGRDYRCDFVDKAGEVIKGPWLITGVSLELHGIDPVKVTLEYDEATPQ